MHQVCPPPSLVFLCLLHDVLLASSLYVLILAAKVAQGIMRTSSARCQRRALLELATPELIFKRLRVFAVVRFYKFTSSKIVHEGKICGKFLTYRQKCTSSKVGFDQNLRYFSCLSVFLAYNAPSIHPRQNASARAYV